MKRGANRSILVASQTLCAKRIGLVLERNLSHKVVYHPHRFARVIRILLSRRASKTAVSPTQGVHPRSLLVRSFALLNLVPLLAAFAAPSISTFVTKSPTAARYWLAMLTHKSRHASSRIQPPADVGPHEETTRKIV